MTKLLKFAQSYISKIGEEEQKKWKDMLSEINAEELFLRLYRELSRLRKIDPELTTERMMNDPEYVRKLERKWLSG